MPQTSFGPAAATPVKLLLPTRWGVFTMCQRFPFQCSAIVDHGGVSLTKSPAYPSAQPSFGPMNTALLSPVSLSGGWGSWPGPQLSPCVECETYVGPGEPNSMPPPQILVEESASSPF